ncbi:hypothetical protein CY34DRAFT_608095 [Suillus luteus UH-Slu-Lm8-n1]|uniref:Uncharacterized protein n=1 Tax=Suillus luteus UH-Slu-Lm8-n1 TaxID=930992 RepID=A0A0D0AA30_9AGAM|nr:hypothetical protein CY34DRAFT_608095 [Suillus luteus UH-Slu-Lm8-n1]
MIARSRCLVLDWGLATWTHIGEWTHWRFRAMICIEDKCADGHPSRTTKFTKIPLPLGQSSTWQRVAKHLMPPSTTLGHVLFSSIHGD